MPDPNRGLTSSTLEARLTALLELPHNRELLRGKSPADRAAEIARDVRSGFIGEPTAVEFQGPKRFLRAVGARAPMTNAFGGWWFDEAVLRRIENELSRIPLSQATQRQAVLGRLRAALAVRIDWSDMGELWLLELPAAEAITGLVGTVAGQPLSTGDASRVLRGGEQQIFFLTKNPFWIRPYRIA